MRRGGRDDIGREIGEEENIETLFRKYTDVYELCRSAVRGQVLCTVVLLLSIREGGDTCDEKASEAASCRNMSVAMCVVWS